MSVDKFGDCGGERRGKRGYPGPKGDDGLNIIKFMPKLTIKYLRKMEETFCFLINEPDTDLKKKDDAYVTWNSRVDGGKNAIAIKPSKSCRLMDTYKPNGRWCLDFVDNLYQVPGSFTGNNSVFFCVQFQIHKFSEEQFLVCDYDESSERFRGISISEDSFHIYGVDNPDNKISIAHTLKVNQWIIILIAYGNDGNGNYYVNKSGHGTFKCNKVGMFASDTTCIGGKINSNGLNGSISAVELYESGETDKIPEDLMKLVIRDLSR